MTIDAKSNCISEQNHKQLEAIVKSSLIVFRTSFSAGLPANILPLKIGLRKDASTVRVKLCNYFSEQKTFLKLMAGDLERCWMIYLYLLAISTSAPPLVARTGLSRFRFAVDFIGQTS